MIIFAKIVLFAYLFREIGKTEASRMLSIIAVIAAIGLFSVDLLHAAAALWIFAVVRLIGTGHLLTAINGKPPVWRTSPFNFLYNGAFRVWRWIPKAWQSWFSWSWVYGFLRVCLAIPPMLVNPFAAVFFAIGLVYYAFGWLARRFGYSDYQADAASQLFLGAVFSVVAL